MAKFQLWHRHSVILPLLCSLLFLLLPSFAPAARILFVGRPDDDFTDSIYQSILIGIQDLNERRFDLALPPTLLPVTLVPFWQTSNASQDTLSLQSLCRDPQTRPHVALAMTGSLVASVFEPEDVLSVFIGQVDSSDFYANRLKLMTASMTTRFLAESAVDALLYLNISSVYNIADFSQFDISGFFPVAARGFINVSAADYLQLAFSETNSDQSKVLRRIANSRYSAYVAMLNPDYVSSVLRYVGVIPAEWMWVDGASFRPTLRSVDTGFWAIKQRFPAFETPRAILTVQQYENYTMAADLQERLQTVLGTNFLMGHQHVEARDMVLLWACAISTIGSDTSSGALLMNAIAQNSTGRSLSARSMQLFVGGPYTYRWSDGVRIRYHILKNLKADVPNPQWLDIAHVLGPISGTGLGLIEPLPRSSLSFATGGSVLPIRARPEIICTFQDAYTGDSPLWTPIYDAWLKLSKAFVETHTPLGIPTTGAAKVKLATVDNRNTRVGSVSAAGQARNLVGSVCSIGPASSRLLQAAASTELQIRVSYASTSDSLSDKNVLPLVMQFATPDRYQASAMADLMKANGWINICTLTRSKGLRVVAAFVKWTSIPDLFTQSGNGLELFGRNGLQWVFSEQALYLFWIRATQAAVVPNLNWTLLDGSIVVHSKPAAEVESQQYQQFARSVQDVTGFEVLPFAAPLIEATQFLRFTFPTLGDGTAAATLFINALAGALRNTSQYPFRGPFGFLNISSRALERTSFHIAASNYLDATSSMVEVGTWVASAASLNSSTATNVTLSEFHSNRPFTYYDGTSFTPKDKISFIFRMQGVETGEAGPIAVMAVAVILAFLSGPVTVVAFFLTRSIPLISASNVLLHVVSSCGIAVASGGAAFWLVDPIHNLVCSWRLLFPFLGATLALVPLAVKAWALRGAFAATSGKGKLKPVSNAHGIRTTLLITVPLLAIVLAWMLSAGGFSVTTITTASGAGTAVAFSWRICASPSSGVFMSIGIAYLLILDACCLFVAFVARSFPALFHEARLLLLAFANILLVSTVGIVIGASFTSNPSVYTFSIPISVLFGCFSTWLIVHVWKIISAIRHRNSRSMTISELLSVRSISMSQAWMLSSTATGSDSQQD